MSYNSGINKWYPMVFNSPDIIPKLSAEIAKLAEVNSFTLQPPTGQQGKHYAASVGSQSKIGEFWKRDTSIFGHIRRLTTQL
jgi:hypothetical protein